MGAPSHDRASYKLWQEPKAPDFVLEITSKSTYSEDQGAKRGVYALLGVKGEPLRSHAESELSRRAAEQARHAAEHARQVADQARQHAEARAEEELRRREALEARLVELEQRIRV